jgi:type III secretion protein V
VGLRSAADTVRQLVFRDLGVPLAPALVRPAQGLAGRHVAVSIHEVPALVFTIDEQVPAAEIGDAVVAEVLPLMRNRAAEFIGIAETQVLLDQLEQIAPATVRQVVPKPVSVTLLSEILRRLVEEGLSVRDLKRILEALSQVAPTDKDPLNLTEFVRAQMRRTISYGLTLGRPDLGVYLLDPTIEDTVRGAVSRTSAGSYLTLAPAAARDIVEAVRRAMSPDLESGSTPVLMTHPDIRRFVRKLIENDMPQVKVVSFAELLPEVTLQPVATVSV